MHMHCTCKYLLCFITKQLMVQVGISRLLANHLIPTICYLLLNDIKNKTFIISGRSPGPVFEDLFKAEFDINTCPIAWDK